MGFFRSTGASGGSGGRGGGRGPVALPNRGTTGTPPPLQAVAPGGWFGGVFAKFGGYYATLPLGQAPTVGMGASPDELHWARPRYDNTAGRDEYSAPTTVSWTANGAIGVGSGGARSPIPTSIKRYDQATFYRWRASSAQRYPNEGEGTPRVHPQQARRSRRVADARRMQPGHRAALTVLPASTSYGAGTVQVLAPFQQGSVFG